MACMHAEDREDQENKEDIEDEDEKEDGQDKGDGKDEEDEAVDAPRLRHRRPRWHVGASGAAHVSGAGATR